MKVADRLEYPRAEIESGEDKVLEMSLALRSVRQNPLKLPPEFTKVRPRLFISILRVHQAYGKLVYPVWRVVESTPTSWGAGTHNWAARFDPVAFRRGALVRLFHGFLLRTFVSFNLRLRHCALIKRNFLLIRHNPRVYHPSQSLELHLMGAGSTRRPRYQDPESQCCEAAESFGTRLLGKPTDAIRPTLDSSLMSTWKHAQAIMQQSWTSQLFAEWHVGSGN